MSPALDMVRTLVGFDTTSRESNLSLIAFAQEHPIDLVVCDVVLPDMGGADVVATLRRIRPDARALFMSGYAEETVRTKGIAPDLASFLAKPFTAYALAHHVRDALRR